jgi:hypothetical protein
VLRRDPTAGRTLGGRTRAADSPVDTVVRQSLGGRPGERLRHERGRPGACGLSGRCLRRRGRRGRRLLDGRWILLGPRLDCGRRRRGGRRSAGHRSRRGRGRGRRCRRSRRKQREGIDVAVLVLGRPDAEMDVRNVELRRSTLTDPADRRRLVDVRARTNGKRAEMGQRDGIAVLRPDAQRQPVAGRRAGERDGPRRGSENRRVGDAGDIDAAVLSARIRVRMVEGERAENRPVGRPGPGGRASGQDDGEQDQADDEAPQELPPCCQMSKRARQNNATAGRCQL